MGLPRVGFSLKTETGKRVSSPELRLPASIAGTPLAKRLAKDNPPLGLSLSSDSVGLDISKPGVLDDVGLCSSEGCKRFNVGVAGSYHLGDTGGGSLALFAEQDFPLGGKASLVFRAQAGARFISGEAYSYTAMDKVALSGVKWDSSLSARFRILLAGLPVSLGLGVSAGPGVDLAPGFRAEGGAALMAILSVDDVVGPIAELAGWKAETAGATEAPSTTAREPTRDACRETADGFQLGPNALSEAVAKCSGSALPVFEAMVARLQNFKLVATDPANYKEFRRYLKQFAEGISSGVAASKLTTPEATRMMMALAGFYKPLLLDMAGTPARHQDFLAASLEALGYPYIPLLKNGVAEVKGNADIILIRLLQVAADIDRGAYLPNVLQKLVEISNGSAWLRSHKQDLMTAADKIDEKKLKSEIKNKINSSL